jgi:hypothetical protein
LKKKASPSKEGSLFLLLIYVNFLTQNQAILILSEVSAGRPMSGLGKTQKRTARTHHAI